MGIRDPCAANRADGRDFLHGTALPPGNRRLLRSGGLHANAAPEQSILHVSASGLARAESSPMRAIFSFQAPNLWHVELHRRDQRGYA